MELDDLPTADEFRAIAQAWVDAAEAGNQPYSEDPAVQADILAAAFTLSEACSGIAGEQCDGVYMHVLSGAVKLWAQDAGISTDQAYKRLRQWIDELTRD